MADTHPLSAPGGDLKPGPDGNSVQFNVSDGSPGKITICLSSAQNVTWWKGIKVFGDGSWNAIGLVETQDSSHGPICVTLDIGQFQAANSRLEFWKAKAFGVHTDMIHYTFDPFQYVGKQLSFIWKND
ncbi:hypothetical protein R5W24_002034 [Gemmata sp. JC717]|uniref:hypothetical protein n=1 Tax=Gemmata algarum TaxID=2975278 RepID=UPI0021BAD5EA|nr:hypothetical protein [Gemmata algarum]MDY3552944.1 hypothetical protein [Gemmata algarum]